MSLLYMPNVFVYPPEEDDCPPFCCFDAAQSIPSHSPTQADLDAPGSALDFVSQSIYPNTPAFYRNDIDSSDVVMPRRRNPAVYFYEDQEQGYSDHDDISIRGSSPGNDSEIAEVVKVRRRHEVPRSASESTSKQSKSFKARASKAFSSLRLGRSASRSRKVNDELPSEPTSRAPSPSPLPRRPSITLSSLFTRPSSPSLQSSTSKDSLDGASPPSPTSPVTPTTSSSGDSVLPDEIHTPASGDMHTFVPYASESEDEDEDDVVQCRPVDPQLTPRASQRFNSTTAPSPKASRRRFSVLNLFSSFSSQTESPSPAISTSPSTPTLPVMSRDSLGPSSESGESTASSASSTGPTTPTEGTFPPLDQTRSGGSSLLRRLPSLTKKKSAGSGALAQNPPVQVNSKPSELDNINETSFSEMRLDSLHFADLSFDAAKF